MIERLDVTKFPRTPHIIESGATSRNDLCLGLEETLEILARPVIIQEKVDGSNVGFYFDHAANLQIINRGDNLSLPNPFFKKLDAWTEMHRDALFDLVGDTHVLFGEWLYWRHQVPYDTLPSFFLAHDIYDRQTDRFLSTERIIDHLDGSPFKHNPVLHQGKYFSINGIKDLIGDSQWGPSQMEGVYIRFDEGGFNRIRCKYVTPAFATAIKKHWRTKRLEPNGSVDSTERYWGGNFRQDP